VKVDLPEGVPAEVCALFERLALDLIKRGFTRYSADAILHQIRWTTHMMRGDLTFKANDHWTAPLARWFLAKHPKHGKFFELRERAAA
jgi:hypothetical protein